MFGISKNHDKPPLKVIIVGAGKVGRTLVEQLSQEGNEITIIDKDAAKVENLTNMYDVMGIVGNGATYAAQTQADVVDADLLIAVTDSDELNLLTCTVAKRNGNCSVIARVRDPDYSGEISYLRDKLDLSMIINPELESAREMARLFYLPSALDVNSFAHGQAELVKYRIPQNSILDGVTLAEFAQSRPGKTRLLVTAVERNMNVSIPNGNFRIQAGDIVSFVLPRRDRRSFLKALNIKNATVKDCMIIGGGKSTYYLAKQLIHMGISVKIIEKNPDRCERLSEVLPEAVIINGDGTDEELLKEEGIESVDSFVSLTGIDEQNILLTLFARKVSDTKVITKVNRSNFHDVINDLDLGSIIYPRYVTSEAIIAYARAKRASNSSNIETLYHMYDQKVEAIEFRVDSESRATQAPLSELKLKDSLMIAFINRSGEIILPSGSDQIQIGDTVMVVTTHTGFNDLDDILAE
ncbi:MAG: Trk system potassium transporter TrkA [Lachnospiraceae bacterium]|nr:Trk system potassium transporter TrkA [Lachnospiraceae bacterium]